MPGATSGGGAVVCPLTGYKATSVCVQGLNEEEKIPLL